MCSTLPPSPLIDVSQFIPTRCPHRLLHPGNLVAVNECTSAVAAKAQLEEKLADITDPLDYVYAVMPHIQVRQ